jgi:hypothetical protein
MTAVLEFVLLAEVVGLPALLTLELGVLHVLVTMVLLAVTGFLLVVVEPGDLLGLQVSALVVVTSMVLLRGLVHHKLVLLMRSIEFAKLMELVGLLGMKHDEGKGNQEEDQGSLIELLLLIHSFGLSGLVTGVTGSEEEGTDDDCGSLHVLVDLLELVSVGLALITELFMLELVLFVVLRLVLLLMLFFLVVLLVGLLDLLHVLRLKHLGHERELLGLSHKLSSVVLLLLTVLFLSVSEVIGLVAVLEHLEELRAVHAEDVLLHAVLRRLRLEFALVVGFALMVGLALMERLLVGRSLMVRLLMVKERRSIVLTLEVVVGTWQTMGKILDASGNSESGDSHNSDRSSAETRLPLGEVALLLDEVSHGLIVSSDRNVVNKVRVHF